jgi:glycine betaine/proline transport system substrate-binding protein
MKYLGFRLLRNFSAVTLILLLAGSLAVAQAETIKFAAPPWPGAIVKAAVAKTILEDIGYDSQTHGESWSIALQSVVRGDFAADLDIWMPTQKSTVEPLAKSGKIDLLVQNVPDAQYGMVVPDYVWKAGVHSIGDLDKHADKFDHRVYGIEAGNDGNQIVKDAIKNNTYDLGDWHLRPSSTAAMLTEAKRHIAKKKWIVFLGWKPHWMNIKYDLKYLKDPKKIWGGSDSVWTAINPDFKDSHPNVTRFLKQMVVSSKIQSQWIYDFGFKKQDKDAVVQAWIQNNMDTVAKWLDGVKTADGSGSALAAVKKAQGA